MSFPLVLLPAVWAARAINCKKSLRFCTAFHFISRSVFWLLSRFWEIDPVVSIGYGRAVAIVS